MTDEEPPYEMLEAMEAVALIKGEMVRPWSMAEWEALPDSYCNDVMIAREAFAEYEKLRMDEAQDG